MDRLKSTIDTLTADGTQVTILAHSMGGLISAYLVGSDPTWARVHVASVVTFDSMPEGFDYPPVSQFVYSLSGACVWGPLQFDPSIAAMWKFSGTGVVSAAREACKHVPFYTIDAKKFGVLSPDLVPYNVANFSLLGSGCNYEIESNETYAWPDNPLAFEHTGAWINETPLKNSFVQCAVRRCSWSAAQVITVPPGTPVNSPVLVAPDSQYGLSPNALDAQSTFPDTTLPLPTMCMMSPSGTVHCPPSDGSTPSGIVQALSADDPLYSSGPGWQAWRVDDPEEGTWVVQVSNSGQGDVQVGLSSSVGYATGTDVDSDGVPDGFDLCPGAFDPFQLDTDTDALGDACDPNDDNDARADSTDNCPLVVNDDQADTDSDGLGDLCDLDSDNDGMGDAVEAGHPCLDDGSDDASEDPDIDTLVNLIETLIGTNPCSADTDTDTHSDALEVHCGASPDDALSTPERLDDGYAGVDDNVDGLTDEALPGAAAAYDCDNDGLNGDTEAVALTNPQIADTDDDSALDSTDNCPLWPNPTQAMPLWNVSTGDSDCDGFSNAAEMSIGTDPTRQCPGPGGTPDSWPADTVANGTINILDVTALKPVFGQDVPPASARYDLAGGGTINILDVTALKPFFGKSCS